jgi:hypothetical protein
MFRICCPTGLLDSKGKLVAMLLCDWPPMVFNFFAFMK